MPIGTDKKPYTVFEVVKPVEVQAGKIAPWFGEKGGGIQYEFSQKYQIYYNKEYYERCKISMNKQKLEEVLLLNKVPKDLYSLSGGLPNESYCLEKRKK